MAREYRSKMGYLRKDDIQTKIDAGVIDAYDYIYTTDTHELYIISATLQIIPVKSRFDVYESVAIAEETINTLSYTYSGQIVMIQTELDGIKPFVVNYNAETEKYYVLEANGGHSSAIVDYNLSENHPIDNIVGNDTVLSHLANGTYSVTGSYRICESDPTIRVISDKVLFTIWHDKEDDRIVYVTEFGDRIKFYTCSDEIFITDRYVLASELEDKIIEVLDENIDEYIDENIDENTVTPEDIDSLFS